MKMPSLLTMLGFGTKMPTETQKEAEDFDPEKLGPKEIYLTWDSLVKAEIKEINKRFSRTFIIIAAVVAVFLLIMQEIGLIFVVAALMFFVSVLNKMPEENVPIEVSNYGFKYDDKIYYWYQLKNFFFKSVKDTEVLAIDTYLYLPGRLFISFDPAKKQEIQDVLMKKISMLTVEPKTLMDKIYDKIVSKMNI